MSTTGNIFCLFSEEKQLKEYLDSPNFDFNSYWIICICISKKKYRVLYIDGCGIERGILIYFYFFYQKRIYNYMS